ncbi:MAG: NAD(P)-binding domain-containing protein [Gemmatimonas sp.]
MFTLPFHVVGCSHESTDVITIGRLGITEPERSSLLRDVSAAGMPCVLLSTCNRTELYWWGAVDAAPIFRAWVTGRLGVVPARAIERRDADLAVRHLFAVAAGLRSQRLGEPEVLGQLRRAWMVARDIGVTVAQLDGVFQRGIQAARRIRARAGECDWGHSLGEAAADFLEGTEAFAWDMRRVLIVGTGAAAESAALAVARRSPASLTILSRTDARAGVLAGNLGASCASWHTRTDALQRADVVIFATRAKSAVLNATDAAVVIDARGGADTRWLDLGVPPNVETPAARRGLSVYSLADLPQDLDATAEGAAIACDALQQELARFASELHRRSLAERLPAMESIANDMARDTVQRLRGSIGVADASGALAPEFDAAVMDAARRMTRLLLREIVPNAQPR